MVRLHELMAQEPLYSQRSSLRGDQCTSFPRLEPGRELERELSPGLGPGLEFEAQVHVQVCCSCSSSRPRPSEKKLAWWRGILLQLPKAIRQHFVRIRLELAGAELLSLFEGAELLFQVERACGVVSDGGDGFGNRHLHLTARNGRHQWKIAARAGAGVVIRRNRDAGSAVNQFAGGRVWGSGEERGAGQKNGDGFGLRRVFGYSRLKYDRDDRRSLLRTQSPVVFRPGR